MEEILLEFVAKTLNRPKLEVAGLIKSDEGIKEDALEQLLTLSKSKIAELKETAFNDGERKARKEVLSKFEKEVAEEYGIEPNKKGKELIAAILESKTPKAGELSEDQVKKHPYVLGLENKLSTRDKEKDEYWQSQLSAKEKEWNQKQTFAQVKEKALEAFHAQNPILSTDPKKAANQRQILVRELEKYGYDIVGEQIIVNKPEGGILEDEHGNKVRFTDFVKQTASNYFDFQVATQRSSPTANDKQTGTPVQKAYGDIPKTDDEYLSKVRELSAQTKPDMAALNQLKTDYFASKAPAK